MGKIKQIQRELQQIEQEYTLQKEILRKQRREKSVFTRISHRLDQATLALCRPFEKRAATIRYKQEDPIGYQANCVVHMCKPLVEDLLFCNSQGNLTGRQREKGRILYFGLALIEKNKLGLRWEEARDLVVRLENALCHLQDFPSDEDEVTVGLTELADMLGAAIGKITGAPPETLQEFTERQRIEESVAESRY